MGRALRISGPGAIHHIISRCNNEELLFVNSEDFEIYLKMIAKYKKEFKFKLYHYCFLHNHTHLQLEIGKKDSVSEIMHRINGEFAKWYNYTHNRKGHFWQNRFKSTLIEDETYFLRCGIYIELNAVRAGLVNNPRQWKYCSVRTYIGNEKNNLVDISPVYLSLGRDKKENVEEYKQMLYSERLRTNQIQQAIKNKNRKKIRRLLQANTNEPIPCKKRITKLFGRGINNITNP